MSISVAVNPAVECEESLGVHTLYVFVIYVSDISCAVCHCSGRVRCYNVNVQQSGNR